MDDQVPHAEHGNPGSSTMLNDDRVQSGIDPKLKIDLLTCDTLDICTTSIFIWLNLSREPWTYQN